MSRTQLFPELRSLIQGHVLYNEPLWKHSSFRIGGDAEVLILPDCIQDITVILQLVRKQHVPLHVIGNATKLLVNDNGVRGVVLKISQSLNCITFVKNHVLAEAGTSLNQIMNQALKHQLTGFEFALGIPGTLGGAIVMNAGTHRGTMSDVVKKVTALNVRSGEQIDFDNAECDFGLRHSKFQNKEWIIINAELELQLGQYKDIKSQMETLKTHRSSTQPKEPNAGCIFKNPSGLYAGRLIDELGFKGKRIGNAQISKIHANFIVNKGQAKAQHVLSLIKLIREAVKHHYRINLELELELFGFTTNELLS